jgi:hypothetical protein
MTIKTKLERYQFIRLAILYHIQRRSFYFFSITAAIITVFAVSRELYPLLVVVWLPFLLYLGIGIFGAYRDGNNPQNPALHPTTYHFDHNGVDIDSIMGHSQLAWSQFHKWSIVARIYVLTLNNGQMLAIPQSAIRTTQVARFRAMLNKHIKR